MDLILEDTVGVTMVVVGELTIVGLANIAILLQTRGAPENTPVKITSADGLITPQYTFSAYWADPMGGTESEEMNLAQEV